MLNNIDWEIQQLSIAVDYYERATEESFYRAEAEEYEETIKKLNGQIKNLERKRDNAWGA